jgi:Fic family protein
MHGALTSLEEYLRRPTNVTPLVRIALVHYQFEAIHPFRDGNGRVGRLLITLLLMRERLIREPLLYLSAYFERNRGGYYDHLAAVSREGDRDSWIRYFLEGIHEQARDAVERTRRLFSLQRAYHQRLQTPRGSALPLRLIDALFANPAITVPQAQQLLGVTYRAAAQHVARLVDGGMLRQAGNRDRNRVYVAGEILQLLEGELPAAEPPPIQGVLELD